MTHLSPDAQAVVRICEQLTTQARRIADALLTPAAAPTGATDDAPTTVPADREPAYTAVYTYIRQLGDVMPTSRIERNAIIWHAVNTALDAQPVAATAHQAPAVGEMASLRERALLAEARETQLEDLLRVAHETSNKSEAERARAAQRAETAETELRALRAGLRANGADPTQIQNLWAQLRLRNRQWRETKQELAGVHAAVDRVRAVGRQLAFAATAPGLPETAREVLRDASRRINAALDGTEQPTT